jgi:Copper amine oxidase, enzyme domain
MPTISAHNWSVAYQWSTSSGLVVGPCEYMGVRVLHDAAVPFVYVNYAGAKIGPFTDELRSTSRRIERREIMHGFDLRASYDLYGDDYLYEHVMRFHDDGQFASRIVIQGPGEENLGKHVYHIPFRIDLDVGGSPHDSFQQRATSGRWTKVAREGAHKPAGIGTCQWRVADPTQDRRIAVRAGQFDDSEIWALTYKEVEGWSAAGGAGEGIPGSPGSVPAVYDNNESVQDADVVLWYIAHVPSVELPRACGPWFGLDGYPEPPPMEDDGDH